MSGPDPLISADDFQQTSSQSSQSLQQTRSTMQEAILLIFCFLGLQLTYLTWGLLQEKMMTQVMPYTIFAVPMPSEHTVL